MNFDVIDLIIAIYFTAPLLVAFGALCFHAGRLKERTLAQAAMINAMRNVRELDGALTEKDSREINAKLRRFMNEADMAEWPPEVDL